MRHRHLLVAALLGVALLAGLGTDARAQNIDALAIDLARLRTEVETLSNELRDIKAAERSQLHSLDAQKTDLEVELRREQLRLAQLEEQRDKRKADIEALDARSRQLLPTARAAVAAVRDAVASGIPFHLQERLSAYDELDRQLDQGLLSPEQALTRLWSQVEDELRLARENGLYQQVIQLDGQEVLAEVARLGLTTMVARLPDDRCAALHRDGDGWRWTAVDDPKGRRGVQLLFDSLSRQLRVGYFELPNAFPQARRTVNP